MVKGTDSMYGARVQCTLLMQRLPSMPPMLPHVSAVDFDHAAVVCTCNTCSCDAAPTSSSRGRRTATACAAHAPMPMPPHCADMPPAATAEPHAPSKLVGGRSAHERGLGGMVMLSSPPASLAPERMYRVYTFCSSALTDLWPTWMGTRPRACRLSPSRSRVAAWPHGRVRRTPDLRQRHQTVSVLYR
jgi:hypothetical protein